MAKRKKASMPKSNDEAREQWKAFLGELNKLSDRVARLEGLLDSIDLLTAQVTEGCEILQLLTTAMQEVAQTHAREPSRFMAILEKLMNLVAEAREEYGG